MTESSSSNAAKGGALIEGGASCPVSIRASTFSANKAYGLGLVGAGQTAIEGSTFEYSTANAIGLFGDGLFVQDGNATLRNSRVAGNRRAGVSLYGKNQYSSLTISSTSILCNAIAINVEGAFDLRDGGANTCYEMVAGLCTYRASCTAQSSALEPIAPK